MNRQGRGMMGHIGRIVGAAGVVKIVVISGELGWNVNHPTIKTTELTTPPHTHLLCHHLRAVRRNSMASAIRRVASL